MKASRALGAAGLSFCVGAMGLLAQPQAPQPQAAMTFEVASVKRSGPGGVNGGCHGVDSVYTPGQKAEAPPLGRCVIETARLSHLVRIAWSIGSMEWIKSGPDWIARGDERFNVEAKAENPAKTTERQLLAMLQTLLVERFDMKFHRETVEVAGFALTVGKNGPKLQPSKSADSGLSFGNGMAKPGSREPVSLRARRYSISDLADFLTTFGEHGPGVDKTGLTGIYDFTLSWDDDNGPTLDTALKEQLGLQMKSEKVPVSYFVIDSAKRPSDN
jgi:uncharacterized protein (TIGR03435 family)